MHCKIHCQTIILLSFYYYIVCLQDRKPDISQIEVLEPTDSLSSLSEYAGNLQQHSAAVCRANKRAHDHLQSIERNSLPSVQEQKVAFSMSLVDEMHK